MFPDQKQFSDSESNNEDSGEYSLMSLSGSQRQTQLPLSSSSEQNRMIAQQEEDLFDVLEGYSSRNDKTTTSSDSMGFEKQWSEPLLKKYEATDPESKSDHSALKQHSTPQSDRQNPQKPTPKKLKKDWGRNIPQSVLNMVRKAICSKTFDNRLIRIRKEVIRQITKTKNWDELSEKIGLGEFQEIIRNLSGPFALKDVLRMVDFKSYEGKEKFWRMMFHHFCQWYLRRHASVAILESDQCEYKQLYMRTLKMYLYIEDDKKQKSSRNRVQKHEKSSQSL